MEIKIYTTDTCPWCPKLKDWLKKKKVSFQEIDTVENDKARDEMIEVSGQMAVPVTVIKNGDQEKVIVGFNEAKLNEAIGKGSKR